VAKIRVPPQTSMLSLFYRLCYAQSAREERKYDKQSESQSLFIFFNLLMVVNLQTKAIIAEKVTKLS
jgi:hypothetical protein